MRLRFWRSPSAVPIVGSQSGQIFVKSTEGRGTTFTVKRPVRVDVAVPSPECAR